jgi:topoisomerase IA-like protein
MKSKSPNAFILELLKDRDIEQAIKVEKRQKGACNIASLKKQHLSSKAMKLIYGNDGTYIHHSSVDKKLAEWRKEYLKRRSEPKKHEPMLYFLDYFNGAGF